MLRPDSEGKHSKDYDKTIEIDKYKEIKNTGEIEIIEKFIAPGNIVFDIGAYIGLWTKRLLKTYSNSNIKVHLFEPIPSIYIKLIQNLDYYLGTEMIIPNNCGIGSKEEARILYYYEDAPSWSTFYRRFEVENQYNLNPPKEIPVLTTTLDNYSRRTGIKHIHFLKIDVEGGELDVLHGAQKLLKRGRIDYIQFEYGGTFLDAGITLKQVFEYLKQFKYEIFRISKGNLNYLKEFLPYYENFEYTNYLAVNERLYTTVLGKEPKMFDLLELCKKHDVIPRGVIHIGAYEGAELGKYLQMGINKFLFIEANPEVFKRLKANVSNVPGVIAVNYAVSDHDGVVTLHVTSMDQSSSILPLKRHKEIYPDIYETQQIVVQSRKLDTILEELNLSPSDFNLLNIDIQGAEFLAFKGAINVLKNIEAINTEVNYEELYEGCALIDQIDNFLETQGFERVATISPFHPSWGDAFYVKKPVITMSTLGKNGGFGNQIFQYAFLKIYAKEHNFRVETPKWIGQYLFNHNDPQITKQLPIVRQDTHNLSNSIIPNAKEPFKNVDFWGYFQYHTKYYAPHKEYFRSLFKPILEIENRMKAAIERIRLKGKTIIGIHIRLGDYVYDRPAHIAPIEWYKEWLKGLWETIDKPVLFIASDEIGKVINEFAEYSPVTANDLDVELVEASFYADFYILTQCDIVAISNSTFSFTACMLNEQGKFFFRPHFQTKKLIPFDPWNSEPLLRELDIQTFAFQGVVQDNLTNKEQRLFSDKNIVNFHGDRIKQTLTVEKKNKYSQIGHSEKFSCIFLNVYYPAFLKSCFISNPQLAFECYKSQKYFLQATCFGDSDFYSEGLKKVGWDAEDLIINCQPLQEAWAKENSFSNYSNILEIAIEQIKRKKPRVVYFQDISIGTQAFISAIRPFTELIVGQIACPIPHTAYLKGFDIIFSSFPHYVERFRNIGITSYYMPLAFEPKILEKLGNKNERKYKVTFIGSISPVHSERREFLEKLAELIDIDFWGCGFEFLPQNSILRKNYHGEAWGLEMFSILNKSFITINHHINAAENFANNMRLFEATGCGALLITDYKDNLNELFEIGKEVVAYRIPEECASLIKYYLANPKEAEEIARAGQKRTLQDHTYIKRMEKTAEFLERHLRYKRETYPTPDLTKISYGYQTIDGSEINENLTSAWKSEDIPEKQRALVQRDLRSMYKGNPPTVFKVLADCLQPFVFPNCSILEIGCSSGYYYEIIEYLLNINIDYTGVDYSEAFIKMAKDYYPKAKFYVADGASLPFEDEKFYIGISGGILLHTPNYKEHIKETARVAKKYIIAHRTPICRQKETQFFKKYAYGVETLELRFNENEFILEFKKNGFKLINFIEYFSNPKDDIYEVSYIFKKL